MAKGPGLFGSLFGRKKNKKNKDVVAAPLPAPEYPKDPAPIRRDIRIEPMEIHYDLPEEPIVEKKGERKSSDSNGVTTIDIPPIQIDEEVIIEVDRRSGVRERNGKKEEPRRDSEPSSRESRKRVPAPPPPLSPELQQQLNAEEVKYSIKKPAEPLSPSSQTSDQLRDLASSGAPTPQPTREHPIPRGIVVEVHPNHPSVRPKEEETSLLTTTREYSRKEERIRERVETIQEFPRFAPPPPSVSPMPKLPAMRVTVDRRPPSPPPPHSHSPVTRVVESRREYSRDTVMTENRSRTVVRTKEVVRENTPSLTDEERMLQKKYDHLRAKFDRWQYLKSTDKENPETKKLQAELMVEHDRVVALLSTLYPADSSGASSASSQRSSPQAPRNGHNGQMRSPSANKETERRTEAPRLEEKTERKKREAPVPNPPSPAPSSSGLSSYSASSSLSSPNSGSKYTRDLNDNLIRRPPKESETTERRKKSSTGETREDRVQKTNGTTSRPKSLLIPAPDYDTTPDYRTTSTLNQSEFFGPSIPYYNNRARTTSDPKYEQRRKESTSSYGSSTLSRRDQPRSQLEWEMAAQIRAEEELKRTRERQQHIRDSTPSSQRSSDSSSYKTMSSGKSNGQSEYVERSFTLPKKSSLPAPPPLSNERVERIQEKTPRLQARDEPRVPSITRPSALPPTPPVVVKTVTTHEVIRPTPIKASPAPPPPTPTATPSAPSQSVMRDVPVKLVGPAKDRPVQSYNSPIAPQSQPQSVHRSVATLPVKRVVEQKPQPMMMAKEEFSTATLKKVGPPREQSAVALGRVVDTPVKTPSSSIPPAPPLPSILPTVSSPSTAGPIAPPPPPPPVSSIASPRTAITAEALRGVQLKPAKERPVHQPSVSSPTTPQSQADVKDQLMAAIRGGVTLRKVSSPAKVQ
ncbi:hypothetical protein PRIPAC_92683 [Pristionchus pacificus]|uniref:WH2 domain-containing protein n=1 Tax=Pristionchus pacificus TaxID=54126 RepID=A0A2A6BQB5_PRIPA|nr:hypothetical protein PRIPAC_92683 [Pristionchus pacificus]|eukprot:PDM67973.1 hypothetical protein PRIPAC_46017 [Pristionchus pacificus]